MSERYWWRSSRCSQVGSEFFFPEMGDNGHEGKSICVLCPVRLICLADAISGDDIEFGIFGGFGRDIRRMLQTKVRAGYPPRQVAAAAIERIKVV